MSQSRQLAAIMFTDIVGYSALMGESEQKAFQLLKKNREVQRPIIERYNGRWLKEIGDGVLASFPTISDAVYCAKEIQEKCLTEPDLKLRVGIHQGEVVFEGGDVFGDGVNIASRLEPLAPAGGILVSESVHNNILNKEDIETIFVGEKQLKNVQHQIKVYQVKVAGMEPVGSIKSVAENSASRPKNFLKATYSIFGVLMLLVVAYLLFFNFYGQSSVAESDAVVRNKSVAVLPFTNMSSDPDQEYFSDGIMEEIINHLVRIKDLKVISRTTMMGYKGTTQSTTSIAKELGVATVLEGSVRKSANRIRVQVQLLEGNVPIWSENYDRNFDDVFAIQSEIAQKVAGKLNAEISKQVEQRIEIIPTQNMEAYDLFLRGKFYIDNFIHQREAYNMLNRAINLDNEFAQAYAYLGFYWMQRGIAFGDLEPLEVPKRALPLLEQAIQLDSNLVEAHIFLSLFHLWFRWDFETAETERLIAEDLDPIKSIVTVLVPQATGRYSEALELSLEAIENGATDYMAYHSLAVTYILNGQKNMAGPLIEKSIQTMVPSDVMSAMQSRLLALAGKYQKTIENFEKSSESFSMFIPEKMGYLALAYYHDDQLEKTKNIIKELKKRAQTSASGSPSFFLGMIYAQLGDINEAFAWLNKAYKNHEVEMYWLKVEPNFKPLRKDPRWEEMLDNVGFPK